MARTRRQHRISLILFVVVAALSCLALGWWQWTRYESTNGTYQNLGYALQWPLFAVFFVYAYRRFVQLERQHQEDLDGEQTEGDGQHDAPASATNQPTSRADALASTSRRGSRLSGLTDRLPGRDAKPEPSEIPAELLPSRPGPALDVEELRDPDDPENRALLEYNDYLAKLAARDTERTTR